MILDNKLGITDQIELSKCEEKISKQKAKQLFDSGNALMLDTLSEIGDIVLAIKQRHNLLDMLIGQPVIVIELAKCEEKISKQKAKQLFDSDDIAHVEPGTFNINAFHKQSAIINLMG
jgi:hypothetical protein